MGPRDHVAIYSYNRIEFVEAMLAAFKLRAVPINVNYRYVEDELVYLLDNSDAVALVHEAQFGPLVDKVRDRLPLLRHVLTVDDGSGGGPPRRWPCPTRRPWPRQSGQRDFEPRSDDDIYILYTGGTTGYPKGVVWRHEDVWRVLGGGIDFITGERIEDEHRMSRDARRGVAVHQPRAGAADARRRAVDHPRWPHQGRDPGAAAAVLRATAVWRAVAEHKIATIAITGDAMAIPLDRRAAGGARLRPVVRWWRSRPRRRSSRLS